jgi:hypothetical protein
MTVLNMPCSSRTRGIQGDAGAPNMHLVDFKPVPTDLICFNLISPDEVAFLDFLSQPISMRFC